MHVQMIKMIPFKKAALSLLMALLLLVPASICMALAPLEVVKIITADDQGKPINFPTSVYFDAGHDEIYLNSGRQGRLIVYGGGPAYLPVISIGAGRGVTNPNGVFVDGNGLLYVSQNASQSKASRLTILNGALLVENEITLSSVAGLKNFIPFRAVKGKGGEIYVAMREGEGLVVLDAKGNFLRRFVPLVQPYSGEYVDMLDTQAELAKSKRAGRKEGDGGEGLDDATKDFLENLPQELRPKAKQSRAEKEKSSAPVPLVLRDITVDSKGNLYLTSEAYGKIYIFSPEEKFLYSFGEKGGAEKKLSRAQGVAIDERKQWAYVVDYMRHTVLAYDLAMDGRYLFEFGGQGIGPGWFNYPSGIAVSKEGYVIIADTFNNRVQVLDVKVEYRPLAPIKKGGN